MSMACDLTPLGVECVYGDGHQLFSCAVHHLTCATRNLHQSLPIVGNLFDDYRCPDFEIKKE